ncbi:hypothetical protein BpHYR1_014096 [Brachionus plicatilis]|uniref:Uncharacterized protein n=1 Tax=Brachionus plicatilis TaxID=10195 RepID=A0A3M7PIP9_BRAPC|nr:hypothetical protein BpHYR1_014096 [Brachionus plicatilis]
MESRREMLKIKLAKMRLRLKQKREQFLNKCSDSSRIRHLDIQTDLSRNCGCQNDSVLSVEVVFDSAVFMSDNYTSSSLSRTSTPICRKPLREKRKKMQKMQKKLRKPNLKENNLYNYSTSIFQSPSQLSSMFNNDLGQLKVWYL